MERMMKPEEVADLLRVSKGTPYSWAYRRRIPFVKVGRSLRFKESDIEELIRSGTTCASRQLRKDEVQEIP